MDKFPWTFVRCFQNMQYFMRCFHGHVSMDFCEVLSEYAVFHEMFPWTFVRCFQNMQYFMRCFHGHASMDFCEVLSQ